MGGTTVFCGVIDMNDGSGAIGSWDCWIVDAAETGRELSDCDSGGAVGIHQDASELDPV